MWSTIAMWSGVAGIIVSIIAIIILFLTRKNIMDILDKDVILFERNFDIKKNAIEKSYKMIDEIQLRGQQITANPEFNERAKTCYNELLCVVSDISVANEFYDIAITGNPSSEERLNAYKISCRKDIGLNIKIAKSKQSSSNKNNSSDNFVVQQNSMNNAQTFSSSNTTFTNTQRPTITQARPSATQASTTRPVTPQANTTRQSTTNTTRTTPPKTTK